MSIVAWRLSSDTVNWTNNTTSTGRHGDRSQTTLLSARKLKCKYNQNSRVFSLLKTLNHRLLFERWVRLNDHSHQGMVNVILHSFVTWYPLRRRVKTHWGEEGWLRTQAGYMDFAYNCIITWYYISDGSVPCVLCNYLIYNLLSFLSYDAAKFILTESKWVSIING